MKTGLCIVLLSITNLAFSQTESLAGKWGIFASLGTDIYRWEEKYPIRWQISLTGGKQVTESVFLGLEVGAIDYQRRKTINFFYGSSGPNSYSAYYAGPKAVWYFAPPVLVTASFGLGNAHRSIGEFFHDTGFYGTGSLSVGVDVLKSVSDGKATLIPTIQYKADYFDISEPGTYYYPEVSKFRNTIFLKMELGVRFGKGKT